MIPFSDGGRRSPAKECRGAGSGGRRKDDFVSKTCQLAAGRGDTTLVHESEKNYNHGTAARNWHAETPRRPCGDGGKIVASGHLTWAGKQKQKAEPES